MMQSSLFAQTEPARVITIPKLRPYQEQAIDRIKQLIREGAKRILVVAPTGCHARGQLVLMHNGSTKRVEDVVVGDRLMGPDGTPREVLQLCRGRQQMARIVPTKGEAWTVNLDHVLSLVRTNDGWGKANSVVDVTVHEWLQWSRTRKHLHKLFRVGVEFPQPKEPLPIAPYFLGVLLGDGSIRRGVAVSTVDPEIEAACREQATTTGLQVRVETGPTVTTYYLSGKKNHRNPIAESLRALGLLGHRGDSKFVPNAYKTASRSERLAILAGLIDTDGALSRGGFDFVSQSERLARDVAFLSRSVGLAAYVSPCEKHDQHGNGGTYWRVSISGDCTVVPTRIPRKQAPARTQKKDVLRTGFSVELLDEDEYFGFALDRDRRYLLDDFTVTHNSGKTVLFARLVAGACAKASPSLILAHRGELLEQTWRKVEDAGVPREQLGMVWASDRRANARALCQIASVQTLVRRRPPPAKLVVIDESHRALGESYKQIVAEYPDAILVGFTATPWRLDGQGLGQLYERIVVVASVSELIEQGFLCKPRVFSHPSKPDLSGVKLKGGDYDERALAKAVDTKVLVGSIVEHWQLHAQGARTIAFACSVEHSKNIVAAFVAAGIPAEHVDGETPAEDRAATLARLASGETRVVSNCSLFTEGFDSPGVKCVILARPTKSLTLYMQCVGRGMRPDPAFPELKTCLVLDHAGCAHEHGLPQDPRDYSLEDGKRSRRTGEAPIKQCLSCFAINPTTAVTCEECGTPFPSKEKATLKEEDGTLKEIEDNEERRQKLEEARISKLRKKCQALALTFEEQRGWTSGKANQILCNRFGSRTKMTAGRLEEVIEWIKTEFPKIYPLPENAPTQPSPKLANYIEKLVGPAAPEPEPIEELSL